MTSDLRQLAQKWPMNRAFLRPLSMEHLKNSGGEGGGGGDGGGEGGGGDGGGEGGGGGYGGSGDRSTASSSVAMAPLAPVV